MTKIEQQESLLDNIYVALQDAYHTLEGNNQKHFKLSVEKLKEEIEKLEK
jgi:hypothetical protein